MANRIATMRRYFSSELASCENLTATATATKKDVGRV